VILSHRLRAAAGNSGASWDGPVTSGYFGSGDTSSVTTNLALPSDITNTNVKISYIEIAGDTNSASEWVTIYMAGTSDSVYGGDQSTTYAQATNTDGNATNFDNLNISSYLTGSSGAYYLSITSNCRSSVGTFVFSNGDRYRVRLVLDNL
tara:strand:- start:34 stop:483 length:450 start_codon:yes stop_codon:yes gene_type:complete